MSRLNIQQFAVHMKLLRVLHVHFNNGILHILYDNIADVFKTSYNSRQNYFDTDAFLLENNSNLQYITLMLLLNITSNNYEHIIDNKLEF